MRRPDIFPFEIRFRAKNHYTRSEFKFPIKTGMFDAGNDAKSSFNFSNNTGAEVRYIFEYY